MNIPKSNLLSYWFFNASATTILPYKYSGSDSTWRYTENITCDNNNERLVTFSFHILGSDCARCYLFYHNDIILIFHDNVIPILKLIFNMKWCSDDRNSCNELFVENEHLWQDMISRLKMMIFDKHYELFIPSI